MRRLLYSLLVILVAVMFSGCGGGPGHSYVKKVVKQECGTLDLDYVFNLPLTKCEIVDEEIRSTTDEDFYVYKVEATYSGTFSKEMLAEHKKRWPSKSTGADIEFQKKTLTERLNAHKEQIAGYEEMKAKGQKLEDFQERALASKDKDLKAIQKEIDFQNSRVVEDEDEEYKGVQTRKMTYTYTFVKRRGKWFSLE